MSNTNELTTVEGAMDRRRVGDMTIKQFGGLTFQEYREAVEFAKLMCQSRHSIPKYLKQNPADCLAIVTQSLRWNLEPFWLAQHSYVAKDNQDSLIAYDAAVHAAIIESKAPPYSNLLKSRPRYIFQGEGEERTCTVFATFTGENEPHEYTTPPLRQCRPKRNQEGTTKGSPLWDKDPDQQQGYYAIRNWGRRYCAAILAGVYDRDEFETSTQEPDAQVMPSPNLMERLPGRMEGSGFQPDVVQTGLADPPPRARKGRRKAAASQAVNIVPPDETAPSEPAPQTAGLSIPVPDDPHADAESPAASPTSGTGATDPNEIDGIETPARIPESADEYIVYAENWISQSQNAADAYQRWDNDVGLRDELQVRIKDRNVLLRQIEETFGGRT